MAQSFDEFRNAAPSTGGFSAFRGQASSPALSAPEQQTQSFGQKFESYLAGERPAIQAKTGLGKVAAFVPNVVGAMIRGPLNKVAEIATTGTEVLTPGSTRQDVLSLAESNRMMGDMDYKVLNTIRTLRMSNKPEDKKKLAKLRDFYISRTSEALPEAYIPKTLDKASAQSFGEAAELTAFVGLMGHPGIQAVGPFKKSTEALITGGIKGGSWSDIATTMLGYGIENAGYAAIAEAATPRKPGEKLDLAQSAKNIAINTVIGTPLSFGIGVGLGRLFHGKVPVTEVVKDVQEAATPRLTRGIDHLPSQNLERKSAVNAFGKGARSVSPEFPPTTPSKVDFRTVYIGDAVVTKEGISGVVTGMRNYVPGAGVQAELEDLLQASADLTRRIETFKRSGGVRGGGAIMDFDTSGVLDLMNTNLNTIQKRIEVLQEELPVIPFAGQQPSKTTVTIRTRDSKTGKMVEVVVPSDSLTKGGRVTQREYLVPSNSNATPGQQRLAAELTAQQLQVDRPTVNIPGPNNTTQALPIAVGPDDVDSSGLILNPKILARLRANGHLIAEPGFNETTVKRVGPEAYMLREDNTLRKSGISAEPLRAADKANDDAQLAYFNRLRSVVTPAMEDLGIFGNTFFDRVRSTVTPGNREKIADLSKRLFLVADGRADISTLSVNEQAIVNEWKSIAKDLMQRSNTALIALGKEPVAPRANYITHVLTSQALATKTLTGSMPPGFDEMLLGKRAASLFRKLTPDQVKNALLRHRTGVLPIEDDFFRAANVGIQQHTRFATMQPALTEMNLVIRHFNAAYGSKFPTNAKILVNIADKLAGKEPTVNFLRAFDQKLIEFMSAEKHLGIPNPLRNMTTEMIDGSIDIPIRVGKDAFTPTGNESFDKFVTDFYEKFDIKDIRKQVNALTSDLGVKVTDVKLGGSYGRGKPSLLSDIDIEVHVDSTDVKDIDKIYKRVAGKLNGPEGTGQLDLVVFDKLGRYDGKPIPENPMGKAALGPVRDITSQKFEFRVPKKGVLNAVEKFGISRGVLSPRAMKQYFFRTQLAFSVPYMVTNMTQFWTLTVPKLRGSQADIYVSAAKGWGKAWQDFFDPEVRAMWEKSGLLTETQKFITADGAGGVGTNPLFKSTLGEVMNFTTSFSEFLNRVGTYHAQHFNALRTTKFGSDGMSMNKYYKELNGLTKGKLGSEIAEMGRNLSDLTNFKFGIADRAPISDDPVGALWDQFNGFTRNWFNVVGGMLRKMKEDPELHDLWVSGWKNNDMRPFLKKAADAGASGEERGEFVRFFANGLLFMGTFSLLGAGVAKTSSDVFLGGGTRFAEGFKDVWQGFTTADQDRMDRGLKSILLPPSVPPLIALGTDTLQFVRGKERISLKRLAIEEYSPIKKIFNQSIPALKALLLQTPQPVLNPATGNATSYIDPKDAVQTFFMGYTSRATQDNVKTLSLIAASRAAENQKEREKTRRANDWWDELSDLDESQRLERMNGWTMEGELDTAMAKRMLDVKVQRTLYLSGTIERALKETAPATRAEVVRSMLVDKSRAEREEILMPYVASGLLGPEDLALLLKK
jgi:predicted nucleotidyltransferase